MASGDTYSVARRCLTLAVQPFLHLQIRMGTRRTMGQAPDVPRVPDQWYRYVLIDIDHRLQTLDNVIVIVCGHRPETQKQTVWSQTVQTQTVWSIMYTLSLSPIHQTLVTLHYINIIPHRWLYYLHRRISPLRLCRCFRCSVRVRCLS